MVTKLLVVVFASLQMLWVSSYNLTISPHHVRESRYSANVTYTCTADVPLTSCQFVWRNSNGTISPVLDLNRGPRSNPNSTYLADSTFNDYSYSGRGLAAGDCGITLNVWSLKEWMIACRVKAATGGWKYAWADLFAENFQHLPTTVPQRMVVVIPGKEAKLLVKTNEAVGLCRYSLPRYAGLSTTLKSNSPLYHGAGLSEGECGISLANVTGKDNGPTQCFITSAGYSYMDSRFMVVIVASPPRPPVLKITREGNNVTASCEVEEGRPIAEISWLLDDNVIRQDSVDDRATDPKDEWWWPWMQGSIMQTLTLELQSGHTGKVLKCRVSHMTLEMPLEVSDTISYTAPAPEANKGDSCTNGEVRDAWVLEAGAAARTALLLEEAAKLTVEGAKVTLHTSRLELEAAKSEAIADAALLKVVEARARETEAWANNAQEELVYERERRGGSLKQMQAPDKEQV